ncbi:MAG: ATP synthase F0 subunit B [Acidobacteria bacterium]|nr:ATP synthase F0 subunit B [Acidobacteriota bacterium]
MFTAILYWQTQFTAFFLLAEEGAHGVPIHWKIVNLAVFLIAIVFLVRKPFTQAMNDRRDSIKSELNRAKAEKEVAEAKLREIQGRLSRLEEEIIEIRDKAEKESQAEYVRLTKQTQEETERLRLVASREIEGATKAAQMELKKFAAEKAVEMAESLIRKELKPEDNARLVSDFAKELEGVR